jgi:membrane-associated protease RseP (regulator of RpoE activity)
MDNGTNDPGYVITFPAAEPALPAPEWAPRPRYWLHGLLFLLTCFTTLVVGARMQYNFERNLPVLSLDDGAAPFFPVTWVVRHPSWLEGGIPFSASLMLILLSHEMGHYLYCRYYGVSATLPFFIPGPPWFGTFGAFIRIRSLIFSRRQLFDIGVAGPIAGFVVSCAVLVISLGMSKALPAGAPRPELQMGFPEIFRLAQNLLAASTGGVMRLPLDRIILHPMAVAAWVGMFATALNLLPGGQLDGGHILFAIFPRAHRAVSFAAMIVLLAMAYFCWTGWLVWAIFLGVSSYRHPPVAERPRVSGVRAWLALFAVLMLGLTLTPAPFEHASVPEFVRQLRQ